MPVTVNKTLGPNGDYKSWAELCAVARNCVANDEAWIVTVEAGVYAIYSILTGWNLDATRTLTIKGATNFGTSGRSPGYNNVLATTFSVVPNTTLGLDIHDMGTDAYIYLEDLVVRSVFSGAGAYGLYISTNTGHVHVTCRRCIIREEAGAAISVYMNGGASSSLRLENCYVSGVTGSAIYRQSGSIQAYNCTFVTRTTAASVNLNTGTAADALKNCYASSGSGAAYTGLGVAVVTTCASYDASSPTVALRNIAFSHVNFKALGFRWEDMDIIAASSLIASGTDITADGYATDIRGRARTILTPCVGCTEYQAAESPVVVRRSLCLTTTDYPDYASMSALAALNLDLVAANMVLIVEALPSATNDTTTTTFSGWNIDATRYLHLRAANEDGVIYRHESRGQVGAAVRGNAYKMLVAGASALLFGNNGTNALIILEDLRLYSTGGNSCGLGVITSGRGILRAVRCKLAGTGTTTNHSSGFRHNPTGATNPTTSQLINCTCFGAGSGIYVVAGSTGTVHAYNCTAVCFTTGAGVTRPHGIDMNNLTGSVLFNCYALTVATGGTDYANVVGVTMTTCGSDDATGSVGCQNLLWDDNNVITSATPGSNGVVQPTPLSAFLTKGTAPPGPAPFNYTDDHNGNLRPASPSLGAYDHYDVTKYPSFTETDTNFSAVNVGRTTHFAEFGSNLYCGTYYNFAKPGEIYVSADAILWTNSKTYSNSQECGGLVVHDDGGGDDLYAIRASTMLVEKFDGAAWSGICTANLGAAAGNPNYPGGLVSHGGLLLAACQGAGYRDVYSSATGVTGTWATEHTNAYLSYGKTILVFPFNGNAYVSNNVPVVIEKEGGQWRREWYFPSYVSNLCPGLWQDDNTMYISFRDQIYTGVVVWRVYYYDKVNKRWWEMQPILDASIAAPEVTALPLGDVNYINGFSSPVAPAQKLQFYNDGPAISTSWNGLHPFVSGGTQSIGGPDPGGAAAVTFAGRIVTGEMHHQVAYSPVMTNALQMDGANLENGRWNYEKYAASCVVKSLSGASHPYTRMTIATKDDSSTSPDWSARYTRNYYTIPPSGYWKHYRLRCDSTVNYFYVYEDGIRFFERIYKENQTIDFQGPCLTKGSLIPVAYVDPQEAKTADTVLYGEPPAGILGMNKFSCSFKWVPTCAWTEMESTIELARIFSDANNYIKIEYLGLASTQRSHNPEDVYGVHDPTFKVTVVRGGVPQFTETLVIYHTYGGTDGGVDWMLDDMIEFEIVFSAGELFSFIARRGAVEGVATHVDPLAFAGAPKGLVQFSGVGYFGAPRINNVQEGTRETGNPARKLPLSRMGVARRLNSAKKNTILVGDRDPQAGIINPDFNNPFLNPDAFVRPDDPNLGDDWTTVRRLGAGWYIEGDQAKCSTEGWERWVNYPFHADVYVAAIDLTISNNANIFGVFARYVYGASSRTCYSAEITQTAANAADLTLSLWYIGTRYILATQALSSYTAGAQYHLMLVTDGSDLTGYVLPHDMSSILAIATATNTVLPKPGRVGIYGITGGVGEVIALDGWGPLMPNYTTSIT